MKQHKFFKTVEVVGTQENGETTTWKRYHVSLLWDERPDGDLVVACMREQPLVLCMLCGGDGHQQQPSILHLFEVSSSTEYGCRLCDGIHACPVCEGLGRLTT